MGRKYILICLLAALLALSACSGPTLQEKENSANVLPNKVTVEMAANGFSPNSVNINAGDTVVFLNKDAAGHWPASAVHPSHEELPGFDSLGPINPGESYEFTFRSKGKWKYHDHMNPANTGVVIVS